MNIIKKKKKQYPIITDAQLFWFFVKIGGVPIKKKKG
jgi:hypothetical protein